jgi:bifunctional DNase/RNase
MIEVGLSRIVIDEKKKEQVIVLKEKEGTRVLPIVIGINEASAIKMKLSGFIPPRPLTHDLILNIISGLGIKLEKVVIDKLIEGTFHAKLHFQNTKKVSKIVDARPSDSVALAIRTVSPIFVEEQVLNKVP